MLFFQLGRAGHFLAWHGCWNTAKPFFWAVTILHCGHQLISKGLKAHKKMPANLHKNLEGQVCLESSQKGTRDGNTFPSVNGSNLFFVLTEKERHCHIEMLSIKSLSSRFWFEWLSPKPRGLSSCAFFPNLTSIGSLKEVEGKKRLRAVSPPLCAPKYHDALSTWFLQP